MNLSLGFPGGIIENGNHFAIRSFKNTGITEIVVFHVLVPEIIK